MGNTVDGVLDATTDGKVERITKRRTRRVGPLLARPPILYRRLWLSKSAGLAWGGWGAAISHVIFYGMGEKARAACPWIGPR
jgi:hypothetical protein